MILLFYYPSNTRSNAIETLLEELVSRKYKVLFYTSCPEGDLHVCLREKGVAVFSTKKTPSEVFKYFRHAWDLILFCRKHQVTLVWSNLQAANLVAVFVQYFISAKVICFRHHYQFVTISTQQLIKINHNERLGDQIINKLAEKIIVPSSGVYNGMKKTEKVNFQKVSIIPYVYRFDELPAPDWKEVETIKKKFPCELRLLMVSRLIRLKRHYASLEVMKALKQKGLNIHLFIADDGPEKDEIETLIAQMELSESVTLIGRRSDLVNYMTASDLLLHPSITEASNSAVKEMAYYGRTSIVCSSVGDFDDYIIHKKNGFLTDINNFSLEAEEIIETYYNRKEELYTMGQYLKESVRKRFDISEKSIQPYLQLLQ